MSASYSYSGNPGDSDRDWLRFTVGDTLDDRWLLTDGEVDYLLSLCAAREQAVVPAFDAALVAASQSVQTTVGQTQSAWQQRVDQLRSARARAVDIYGDRAEVQARQFIRFSRPPYAPNGADVQDYIL
jgi:hypothetical protein